MRGAVARPLARAPGMLARPPARQRGPWARPPARRRGPDMTRLQEGGVAPGSRVGFDLVLHFLYIYF
jgi:hypothetical protein